MLLCWLFIFLHLFLFLVLSPDFKQQMLLCMLRLTLLWAQSLLRTHSICRQTAAGVKKKKKK